MLSAFQFVVAYGGERIPVVAPDSTLTPAEARNLAAQLQAAAKRAETRRYAGPVLVRFNSYGDTYAFDSSIPLAVGDQVIVDTRYGRQTGTVTGYGTGRWNPAAHGPLRRVVDVYR